MPKNKNQKTKTILRKDLLNVMAKVRKYYKAESGSVEEQIAYKEWVELCRKTFGDTKKSLKYSRLKDLTRNLRHYNNETVIKVFQALGYMRYANMERIKYKRYTIIKYSENTSVVVCKKLKGFYIPFFTLEDCKEGIDHLSAKRLSEDNYTLWSYRKLKSSEKRGTL